MTRTSLLVDQLHRAFDGDPWHGPSITHLLADVTTAQAEATPPAGIHTIAGIVAHMTSWVAEVTRRLAGHAAADPLDGDWPLARATDEAGWLAMRLELTRAMAQLTEAVAAFPEARWDDPVGDERSQPLGTGVTFAQTVSGVVQHLAYHGGQIAILKKLVRW